MPASCFPSLAEASVSHLLAKSRTILNLLLVYIFVGSILLEGFVLRYVAGAIVGITGVGYCALEFLPQIEPPSNMRDADAGWGAEQV